MSKDQELTHEYQQYGCTIRHTLEGDYATVTTPDGAEHQFSENLGMIAQGAPSAHLLAIQAAKADMRQRAAKKAAERTKPQADQASDLPAEKPTDKPKRGQA